MTRLEYPGKNFPETREVFSIPWEEVHGTVAVRSGPDSQITPSADRKDVFP